MFAIFSRRKQTHNQARNAIIALAFQSLINRAAYACHNAGLTPTPQEFDRLVDNAAATTAKSFNATPEEVKRLHKLVFATNLDLAASR
jgi:hypothetical protein